MQQQPRARRQPSGVNEGVHARASASGGPVDALRQRSVNADETEAHSASGVVTQQRPRDAATRERARLRPRSPSAITPLAEWNYVHLIRIKCPAAYSGLGSLMSINVETASISRLAEISR